MKRANVLVGAGIALLLIGLAAVWLLSRDEDAEEARPRVPVLVAQNDLTAGETATDLATAGRISVVQVEADKVSPGALSSTAELAGAVISQPVAKGAQVTSANTRAANLRSASVTIPEGKQAMAVTVDFTQGAAGYAAAGDRVNLYATVPPGTEGAPVAPFTRLLLTDIEVLDVSDELLPQRASTGAETDAAAPAGRPSLSQLTLLLAVDAEQAEQLAFAGNLHRLWFTVLAKDQGPSETPGVRYEAGYLEFGS